MIVGVFFYLDPYREPIMDAILAILDIVCLVTLIFFVKKLADIGTGDDTEVSSGGIWAYSLILTPIFSIALVWLSNIAETKTLSRKQGNNLLERLSGIQGSIEDATRAINELMPRFATPVNTAQVSTISTRDAECHEAPVTQDIPDESERAKGVCDICGKELHSSGRYHKVNGKDVRACLECYDVIQAMKHPNLIKKCFDYFIGILKDNPKSRTYIGPILMGNQETAEMFKDFLSTPEGKELFK